MVAAWKVELPEELWARILRHRESHFSPTESKIRAAEFKALSLVCQLFGAICQKMLFEEISVDMCINMDYENPEAYLGPLPTDSDSDYGDPDLDFGTPNSDFGSPSPEPEIEGMSEPEIQPTVEKWKWEEWEEDMRGAVYAERRLTLIGTHNFLRIRPRAMRLQGLNIYHPLPANPFLRPPENQAVSRAVFDAFHGLRQTLCVRLAAFANLRRLELSRYPVDNELLKAIDEHSSLTELRFDFCWFPESTSPLNSITSLSFGLIPGSHSHPPVMVYIDGRHPYEAIPDHHVASAFSLISLDNLEHLDVTFGSQHSKAEPILKQLCASTSMKGTFRSLRRLVWDFDRTDVPSSLIVQFLEHTPALRDLAVRGSTPPLYPSSFPPRFLTRLEALTCPLDWAQVFVPGRPVGSLNIWAYPMQEKAKFLASTEAELDNLLRPLTMSNSLTTLHLPQYPPVAPIGLLTTYLAARFPFVRDLKVAVAGERVASSNSSDFLCGLVASPAMPEIDAKEQVVEDGLLEALERDVREDVERILEVGPDIRGRKSKLLPIRDRIKVFGGVSIEPVLEQQDPIEHPPPPRLAANPSPPPQAREHGLPQESPLAILDRYFGKPDDQHGLVSTPEPESIVDLLYFFARGWYTLPPSVQALTIYSCFEGTSPRHYSRSWITPEMDWMQIYAIEQKTRSYSQAVLAELSQVYPGLTEFRYSDVVSNGHGAAFRRMEGHWEPTRWD